MPDTLKYQKYCEKPGKLKSFLPDINHHNLEKNRPKFISYQNKKSIHLEQSLPKRVTFDLSHYYFDGKKCLKKINNLNKKNSDIVLPVVSCPQRYQIAKQKDEITSLYEKLEKMIDYKQAKKTIQIKNDLFMFSKQQANKKSNYRLGEKANQKRENSIEKTQTRGLNSVERNMTDTPSQSGSIIISSKKQREATPEGVFERARRILIKKMQNQSLASIELGRDRRRVIFLPSLAAPCSEEFAITMRRVYGKKFVSSPNILDHVISRHVPLKATASLLDAIVRPPSTPTCC